MKTIGNILWLILCGLWLALGWMFWALIFAVTVVGLPFARQCVKLASFSLWPFRRTTVKDRPVDGPEPRWADQAGSRFRRYGCQ